jgi:hypothetical protein
MLRANAPARRFAALRSRDDARTLSCKRHFGKSLFSCNPIRIRIKKTRNGMESRSVSSNNKEASFTPSLCP